MMKRLLCVTALLVALMTFIPIGAQAQSCSVSISIASTSTTPSTACFVPAGGKAIVALTGTWTGTVRIQRSFNNGGSYTNEQSTTANTSYALAVQNRNSSVRVFFDTGSTRTGTLTGSLIFNPVVNTRIAYPTVSVIGSQTYSTFGIDLAMGAATEMAVADVIIPPGGFQSTGGAVLIGGTTSIQTAIYSLYDASGFLIANTAVAGGATSTASTNSFLRIAWATPVFLPAGRYYLGMQLQGTTTTIRRVQTSGSVGAPIDVVCGAITGTTYGTLTNVIVPPTSCTDKKGPIGYVY